jgi:hypothetical protein
MRFPSSFAFSAVAMQRFPPPDSPLMTIWLVPLILPRLARTCTVVVRAKHHKCSMRVLHYITGTALVSHPRFCKRWLAFAWWWRVYHKTAITSISHLAITMGTLWRDIYRFHQDWLARVSRAQTYLHRSTQIDFNGKRRRAYKVK